MISGGLQGAEFFVGPDGDDAGPGTQAAPFATLERARMAVREARRQAPAAPVTVQVRGGVYALATPLKLDAEDSGSESAPVVWTAHGKEKPILQGAGPATGWSLHQGSVWKAELRTQSSRLTFRQIFFAGRRQEMARYPNLDPDKPFESGWTFVDCGAVAPEPKRMFGAAAADLRQWARPQDGEVCIFPGHEWWNNIVPIQQIDRETRRVTLSRNCNYEIAAGDRYFVRGLLEELDEPGEWYFDRQSGVLYFWPPEPLGDQPVLVPRLRTILELGKETSHVTFRGFTLEYCEGSAVVVNDATACLLAECVIRNVGDYNGSGVSITGGSHNGVVACDISGTGSHGIHLGGGDEKTLTAAENYAEDNLITRSGVFHKQGNGVNLTGTGNRVSGNTLHHLPRFGIQFSGQNHLIERNHIHHVCQETMDTGAIYGSSLNWLSAHGTVIRHNFIHDVIGRSGKAGKWLSPYFAWGIYLDWTAMGVTVTGNVIARTPRSGIMVHDGRDNVIENNILVDCGTGQHEERETSLIELSGWDTSYGWWKREIENWSGQFDSVANQPAWRTVKSLTDPRNVPLPDGRTMQRNRVRRNILAWSKPETLPFLFRNLSFAHNRSDGNLLWHFDQPLKTGQFQIKAATGPNQAPPNADFEQGMAGALPDGWTWHIRPSPADVAEYSGTSPHGGRGCLRLSGQPDSANKDKEVWARIPSVKSAEVPVAAGQVYRLRVWLRAAKPATRVELGFQAYRAKVYHWLAQQTVAAGPEWSQQELVARFPTQPAEMKSFYVRIRLPDGSGEVWADDVELHAAEPMAEWDAWLVLGMDRQSRIADPLFVDPAKDDYRLKPGSPALDLGFEPIAIERFGCGRGESS